VAQHQDRAELVNVTILFADLLDSVRISSVLNFWDYDELIIEYQNYLDQAASESGSKLVAEKYVRGDELALFLYDPKQVERNRRILELPPDNPERKKLEAENTRCENEALFGALRTGIVLKNAWLSAPVNFDRVASRQLPFDLGIGIHNGLCLLRERGDGQARIEGYTINFTKRIEGYSRVGRVTRLMMSRTATQRLRFIRRRHVVMRQRLGFISHKPEGEELKGLQTGLELFELKFFHRLRLLPPEDKVVVFEQLLRSNPVNIWAYHMAVEYHTYLESNYDHARDLALLAYANLPDSEKICYDLATIAKFKGEMEQARFFAGRATKLNPHWDLPFGLLSELSIREDDHQKALAYLKQAYALCPDSPQNCWDLGEAYVKVGSIKEAGDYLREAIELCPELLDKEENLELAQKLGVNTDELEKDETGC
jgi:tetratricopeptide (TPR) repeat protein